MSKFFTKAQFLNRLAFKGSALNLEELSKYIARNFVDVERIETEWEQIVDQYKKTGVNY